MRRRSFQLVYSVRNHRSDSMTSAQYPSRVMDSTQLIRTRGDGKVSSTLPDLRCSFNGGQVSHTSGTGGQGEASPTGFKSNSQGQEASTLWRGLRQASKRSESQCNELFSLRQTLHSFRCNPRRSSPTRGGG